MRKKQEVRDVAEEETMKTILGVTRENEALKDDAKQLRSELEEAKRQVGGVHGDILVSSIVDALLHQAESLSTLVLDQDRYSGTPTIEYCHKEY